MTDDQKQKLRPIFKDKKPSEWKRLYDSGDISFEEMIFLYRQLGKLKSKQSLNDQAQELADRFGGEVIN